LSSLEIEKNNFENIDAFSILWLGGKYAPLDVLGFDWK
jgi:hypothetical protein